MDAFLKIDACLSRSLFSKIVSIGATSTLCDKFSIESKFVLSPENPKFRHQIFLKLNKFPMIGICKIYRYIYINKLMTELPFTLNNISIIQDFLDETKKRISEGVEITFTKKASSELEDLALQFDIEVNDIESAILNLTTENYYRGIDPSGSADFNVCAFCTIVGDNNIKIYLKYGLEVNGLQILLFSNHQPNFPMTQPFKN